TIPVPSSASYAPCARPLHRELCLIAALGESVLRDAVHLRTKDQRGVNRVLDLRSQLCVGVVAIDHLDLDRNRRRHAYFSGLAHDARATGDTRPEPAYYGEDCRRVNVDPADDEHIVAPPRD